LGSWRQSNPQALICNKNNGKPELVKLFMLLQDGKSEKYCAVQISRLPTKTFPARMPQKTKPGPVAPEIGAPTSRNQERTDVASAINNLKAKQAK
jgi:hypothetical protein